MSHKSFVFTSATFCFFGGLASKLRFHIFHFHFSGMSGTKAPFSHLRLSDFERGLARKLRFHIFHFDFSGMSRTKAPFLPLSLLEGSLARNAFLRESGCTKCCVLQDKTCPGRWMGELVRRTVLKHARLNRDRGRTGRAVELPVQASFCPRSCT